ncbi:serine/threonine protein kinase [Sphaerospermopsis aphanizomenoides BCCUSP55]|uniref:serine/threonine protein kinase n=1 Tax=Sphaerospermopsis aphanizomenoides TaxID=459663 RepID=UPI001906254F|nr:serine/threonine-protein kinase [Sphaerospermopsis aphanizomenoides]MBK1986616.1 serine/threonine protein kinase [Sphaerospermopsis aphanizomenoides BCCUSP55]
MEFDINHGYDKTVLKKNYPDFTAVGYQVIQELGHNREGGRITYLAHHLHSHQKVVIKEFSFANMTTDWSGVKAYEREIQLLQQLNHPRIPRYLDSFEKPGFFYLIQEYKKAPSLAARRCFHPEEIKQIALSILDILVYLQQQNPPIIHRDIKPANILVDEKLNVYLVDFGLAKIQDTEVDLSTFVTGTPGFIPPEEQIGLGLTKASDLYSLGTTLICLLTNTHAADICTLIDANYRFNFQQLLPYISPAFRSWLKKMVESNHKRRYANAADALQELKPMRVLNSGNKIDNLLAFIQQRKSIAMLGLATLGILVTVGTNFMISQPGDAINSNAQVKPDL